MSMIGASVAGAVASVVQSSTSRSNASSSNSNTPSGSRNPDDGSIGVNLDAPLPPVLGNIPYFGPYAVRSFSGRDMGRPYQLDLLFYPGLPPEASPSASEYTGKPAIRISFAHGTDEQRRVTAEYEVIVDRISIESVGVHISKDWWGLEHLGATNEHSPQDHQMIVEIVTSHAAEIDALLNDPDLVSSNPERRMISPTAWIKDQATKNRIPLSHAKEMVCFLNERFGLDITLNPIGRGVDD